MYEIRKGLEDGVDITKYNDSKYDWKQMCILRLILEYNKENPDKEINIRLFQNEKILSSDMAKLSKYLILDNQDLKIEAYKKLNKYSKEKYKNIYDDLYF